MFCNAVGSDLSLSFLCLGVSCPTDESDSPRRLGPVPEMDWKDCRAGRLSEVESMDVSDAEGSILRLIALLGVRSRSNTGGDWLGSAESLSELVKADDEDPDSA